MSEPGLRDLEDLEPVVGNVDRIEMQPVPDIAIGRTGPDSKATKEPAFASGAISAIVESAASPLPRRVRWPCNIVCPS